MIDRMILFLAGVMLALIAFPAQAADPFKAKANAALALSPDPFKQTAPKAIGCPCGCDCASCPGVACDCGCPCGLSYGRDPDTGCVYEYRDNVLTGVVWDAQGRKWVDGKPTKPTMAVAAAPVCRS